MKNKIKSTIDAAINVAQEISEKVETAIDSVSKTIDCAEECVDVVKESANAIAEVIEDAPSVDDVLKAMVKDRRVGHFIVDVLTGIDVSEASKQHFPQESSTKNNETDIDSLIAEAEERGYQRGRNEQIEIKMQEPNEWQLPGKNNLSESREPTTILGGMRRSVW